VLHDFIRTINPLSIHKLPEEGRSIRTGANGEAIVAEGVCDADAEGGYDTEEGCECGVDAEGGYGGDDAEGGNGGGDAEGRYDAEVGCGGVDVKERYGGDARGGYDTEEGCGVDEGGNDAKKEDEEDEEEEEEEEEEEDVTCPLLLLEDEDEDDEDEEEKEKRLSEYNSKAAGEEYNSAGEKGEAGEAYKFEEEA
jgi:hypothetical protein